MPKDYSDLYRKISKSSENRNFFDIIIKIFGFRVQLKTLHWQTTSYEDHKAFDNAYDSLDDLLDSFTEKIQGKYGRFKIEANNTIELKDISNIDVNAFNNDMINFLTSELPKYLDNSDTDLTNIRDEILGEIFELKYLLTLK